MHIVTRESKARLNLRNVRETIEQVDSPTKRYELAQAARRERQNLAEAQR